MRILGLIFIFILIVAYLPLASIVSSSFSIPQEDVYVIKTSITNPFLISPDGRFIFYVSTSDAGNNVIVQYDLTSLQAVDSYAITGKLASYTYYENLLGIGTDKGEVLVLDITDNKIVFKYVNAHFGEVTKIGFLDKNTIMALFSTGRLIVYDMVSGYYKVYTDFYGTNSVEEYSTIKPLNFFITSSDDVVVVEERIPERYAKIILLVLNATDGSPMGGVKIWINVSNTIIQAASNEQGLAIAYIPKPTTDVIGLYAEIKDYPDLAYYVEYKINASSIKKGDELVFKYYYGQGTIVTRPSISNAYVEHFTWNGHDLESHGRFQINSTDVISASSIEYNKYSIIYYYDGNVYFLFLGYDFTNLLGLNIHYKTDTPIIVRYSYPYIIIGYSSGRLFGYITSLINNSYSVKSIFGLSLQSAPNNLLIYKDYIIATDQAGFIYVYEMKNNKIIPLYRGKTLGIKLSKSIAMSGFSKDLEKAFFYDGENTYIVNKFFTAIQNNIDLKKMFLHNLILHVVDKNNQTLSNVTVILRGKYSYFNKTDVNGTVVFTYVYPGNYTLIVLPESDLYTNYTGSLEVINDTEKIIVLEYRLFELNIFPKDIDTNGSVVDDLILRIRSPIFGEKQYVIPANTSKYTIELFPGNYTLSVSSKNTIYYDKTLEISIPQVKTLELNMTRRPFSVVFNFLDNKTKEPLKIPINFTLLDQYGRKIYSRITDKGFLRISFKIPGKYTYYAIPVGNASIIYCSEHGVFDINKHKEYNIYLKKHEYNLTIKIIDSDTQSLAENIVLKLDNKEYKLTKGVFNTTVVAGEHVILVTGQLYRQNETFLNVVNDTTYTINLKRKNALLTIYLFNNLGEKMRITPIKIVGIDTSYTTVVYTDPNGTASTYLPVGRYLISVSIRDFKPYSSQIVVLNDTSIKIVLEITPQGIFMKYLPFIIIGIIGIVASYLLYKLGKKKIEKYMISQLEEGV